MKTTVRFFRTVARSFADVRFFREVRTRKVSNAIGYLAVLLILTWLIPFSIDFFIGVRSANDAIISSLRSNVPIEASFKMKDGEFTNNLKEPLVLENNGFTFIVNSASSSLALEENNVGLAVNRDAIVQREGKDDVRIVGYKDFPDFEVDRAGVDEWMSAFGPWIVLLVSIVTILTFSLAVSVGFGFFIALHAFIFSFLMRLLKMPMKFSRAFVIAAYAATVPIVVKAIVDWSGSDFGSAPTYLYWILLGFIAYDFRKEALNNHEMSAKSPQ